MTGVRAHMKQRLAACLGIVVLASGLAACEPISEPWLSEYQAETLADERNRSEEQKQVLRQRLERYGGAYQ